MKNFVSPKLPESIQHMLDEWAKKIEEVRDIGNNILKEDLNIQRGGDEHLPFFLTMRHSIELIDSISILIKNSSIDPCKLLLRGLLESYFNLEYLFKDDWKSKAFQFISYIYYNKLKFYKKLDNQEQSHQNFKSSFLNDKRLGGYPFSQPSSLKKAIENLESLFEKENYKQVKSEFLNLKQNKEGNPNWFRLFGGPKSIKGLTNEIGLEGLYESYYRFWSGPIHGTKIIEDKITSDQNGNLQIYQIKLPFEAQSITMLTISISIFMFQTYIENRIPGRKDLYLNWYSKNRDFYRQLNEVDFITRKNHDS